ncbi:MAG: hypothetical protein M3P30_09510 [Chloroflexota bacterium]|nr:hypothetical protein [Chloroflexota bacterium]
MSAKLLSTVFSAEFLATVRPDRSDAHHYIHRLFIDTDAWSAQQRDFLTEALAMVRRHHAFKANVIRRLRADDDFVFFGQLYELRVAHHFESNGARLRFNPHGRNKSTLEFEALLSPSLLVEVKTPQRRPQDAKKAKQARRLVELAQQTDGGEWISVNVQNSGGFRERRFQTFLTDAIPRLRQRTIEGERLPSVVFRDVEGLTAEVTFLASDSSTRQRNGIQITDAKIVQNHDSLEATVKTAVRQLPKVRTRATMIVICPRFEFPASPQHFVRALYGVDALHFRKEGDQLTPEARFMPTGVLAQSRHRRVSVVAWVNELGSRYNPEFEVVALHHPNPYVSMPPAALSRFASRQLVPGDQGFSWVEQS